MLKAVYMLLPVVITACGNASPGLFSDSDETESGTESSPNISTDSATDTGTASEVHTEGDSTPDTDTDTDTDSDTFIDTDSGAQPDTDTVTLADTGSDTDSEVKDSESEIHLSTDDIEGDWVTVPAGEFVYGSPETQPCRGNNTETQVDVVITHAFKMASTEITRKQWQITGLPDPSESPICDECAQDYVNWFDALYWLNSLSRAAGLAACYDLSNCVGTPSGGCLDGGEACWLAPETGEPLPEIFTCAGNVHIFAARVDCPGYRLPTVAEWEYAARGGTTGSTYNGEVAGTNSVQCVDDPVMNSIGWYCANSGGTLHRVGELVPNAYGLFDMLGNVGEWTSDVHTASGLATSEGKEPPLVDPVGRLDEDYQMSRALRGGFFSIASCRCAASTTFPEQSERRSVQSGLRPVRTILD